MRFRGLLSCVLVWSAVGCDGSNIIGLRAPDATLFDASDASDADDVADVRDVVTVTDARDVVDASDGSIDADVADAPDVISCGMLDFSLPTVDVPLTDASADVVPTSDLDDAARDATGDVSSDRPDVVLPAAPAMQVETTLANTGFTCFAHTNGQGRCVGDNNLGQLGDNTTTGRTRPVPVMGLFGARQVVAGDAFACAAIDNGSVRCWGANSFGQLGDGSMSDHRTAMPVAGVTTAAQVSAGQSHACARLNDGTVTCWGRNVDGQVGSGTATMTPQLMPALVVGLSGALS